jgi:light-harvesting complex 1 beta chain
MARTRLMHDQRSRSNDIAFWIVFVLSFLFVFSIALFGTLTGMRWRRWLPGAESCRSFFGGIRAAVYSFMSYLL